ncbi:MAG: DUF4197 domain-containing protein [Deltaproteobacteria bacterium]|nr:DUF4197 domain-containing protein [Candidatus Anaeroferrophillacea bacterium]
MTDIMAETFGRILRATTLLIATATLSLVPTTANPAAAADSWLERGRQILEQTGGATHSGTTAAAPLSTGEITAGLREALRVGTDAVVARLGTVDGFNADPLIHIPLPEKLETVAAAMRKFGFGGMVDDLELKLNRAAEEATPAAKELFRQAIEEMTIDDVQQIYRGPDDAATRYLEGKMGPPLAEKMRPVIDNALGRVGAVQLYDQVMAKYRQFPLVPDVRADLTGHVVDRGMNGIFAWLAREEAAIRTDPVRRTTDILKRVFGAGKQ